MTNQELNAWVKKNPIPVACIVVALLVGGVLYFRSGSIPAAEAALEQKSAQAEKYAANITYSAQLKEQHDALVTAGKKIEERLTRASEQGVNTQFFYRLERESGARIISFGQASSAPAKNAKSAFVPVGFNVSVQGTLPQVLDFLRQLEGGAHYGRVLSANLVVAATARSGPLTLSLTLELLGLP